MLSILRALFSPALKRPAYAEYLLANATVKRCSDRDESIAKTGVCPNCARPMRAFANDEALNYQKCSECNSVWATSR